MLQVHHLEEKFTVLAENQSDVDDRYSRAKQENAELSTKLFMVEEQLRDVEQRGEDKLREEQRRFKEALGRLDREKQLQIENYEIRLQNLEKDLELTKAESSRYKQQLDRERTDRIHLSDKLLETERELSNTRDDNRKLMDEARADREALTLESIGSQQVSRNQRLDCLMRWQCRLSVCPPVCHVLNLYHTCSTLPIIMHVVQSNKRLQFASNYSHLYTKIFAAQIRRLKYCLYAIRLVL